MGGVNLEHSPAHAPLGCAWPGASAGGRTLRRHKTGPDDAETAMYALFMVVNHAWRRLLAKGGDPKSTAFPARGRGKGEASLAPTFQTPPSQPSPHRGEGARQPTGGRGCGGG